MPLLNYTTTVSADRTVGEIQKTLAAHGAKSIQIDYDEGLPSALAFFAQTLFGERAYVLPANVDGVWQTLVQQGRSRKIPNRFVTKAQAARVAWRIVKDWTEAQMAIIEAGMVSLDQVMLPYMQVGHQSLYDAMKQTQFALPADTSK
jgi:ABC-type uncharacterized transport system substrate-binding protein